VILEIKFWRARARRWRRSFTQLTLLFHSRPRVLASPLRSGLSSKSPLKSLNHLRRPLGPAAAISTIGILHFPLKDRLINFLCLTFTSANAYPPVTESARGRGIAEGKRTANLASRHQTSIHAIVTLSTPTHTRKCKRLIPLGRVRPSHHFCCMFDSFDSDACVCIAGRTR